MRQHRKSFQRLFSNGRHLAHFSRCWGTSRWLNSDVPGDAEPEQSSLSRLQRDVSRYSRKLDQTQRRVGV
jgi:hypothetical protein